MKLKNYAYRCMAVVCAIVAVSCVDEEFSMDKVSKEVSVIDGKTVLPIGSLEKVSLGDLLGSETELPEGIIKNEDGSYEFRYELETTSVSAGDFELPTSFDIAASSSSFNIDLPSLDFSTYGAGVKETFGLDLPLGDKFQQLLQNAVAGETEFEITSLMFNIIPEDQRQFAKELSEEVEIDEIKFDLPEQIKSLNRVIFDSPVEGHDGAPFGVHLDLKGFAGINGGGHFHFILKSKANLVIKDSNNQLVESETEGDYNVYTIESDIEAEEESIGFDIYITAIDSEPTQDRSVVIDPSMVFDIDFELNTKAGVLKLDGNGGILMPEVTIESNFALADAEVVFDSDVDLVSFEFGENGSEGFGFELEALPKEIKSINRIALDDNSVLRLYADGFEWLKDSSDCVSIDMTLPDCLVLRPIGGTYQYDEENHMLTMTIGDISEGLEIAIEAIDFGENGLSSVEGEPISIDFNPALRVHFTQPCDEMGRPIPIGIKSFIPEEPMNLAVGLRPTTLGFESVSAEIDFSYPLNESFPVGEELGEESLERIQFKGFGLSPILQIMITNPLTIEANIEASIAPVVGGVVQEENSIPIPATIKKAIFDEATGEVIPTTTRIVLAKEEHKAKYPESEGYTFIECNLDKLFTSSIPDRIALSAEVGLPKEMITLHLTDSLEFSYGGSFSLPIAFDNQLSISYEDKINILDDEGNSPLASVASTDGIKVGDIAFIAEFETTFPLEFEVLTTLYDKAGKELPTKIGFAEGTNIIKGSADGETEEVSDLRLQFDLADESGSLKELADIASVGLKIAISSNAENGAVSLKDDQYISAVLQLEIDGGVTVDLSTIKNKIVENL